MHDILKNKYVSRISGGSHQDKQGSEAVILLLLLSWHYWQATIVGLEKCTRKPFKHASHFTATMYKSGLDGGATLNRKPTGVSTISIFWKYPPRFEICFRDTALDSIFGADRHHRSLWALIWPGASIAFDARFADSSGGLGLLHCANWLACSSQCSTTCTKLPHLSRP